MAELTKAQRRALEWFRARKEPASMFGTSDPRLSMVKRLCDAGLVGRVGHDPGRFGFVRYAITDEGHAALSSAEGREP